MAMPAICIAMYDQQYFIDGPGINIAVRSVTRFAGAIIKISGIIIIIAGHI